MSLKQVWQLAQEWYSDRLSPQWRAKTLPEAKAALARIGLVGDFWKLPD